MAKVLMIKAWEALLFDIEIISNLFFKAAVICVAKSFCMK